MGSLLVRWLTVAILPVALACCSSAPARTSGAEPDFMQRTVSRTDGQVRVSTAALSAEESARVYGVPLASKAIQPVWIEVENRDDRAYYLLSPGVDPNFFPASEAAEAFASNDDAPAQPGELDRRFRALAFHNPVLPGTTASGFVLTNLDEGGKLVQIDLVASGRAKSFSILAIVPGFRADYHVSGVFRGEIRPVGEAQDRTEVIRQIAQIV